MEEVKAQKPFSALAIANRSVVESAQPILKTKDPRKNALLNKAQFAQ